MHFVSSSDLHAGYFYMMGIAISPEAQAAPLNGFGDFS